MVGVGLSQIGEFSFILVQVARSAGHVGADVYNATLAASLITILVNALLVRVVPRWVDRRPKDRPGTAPAHRGEPLQARIRRIIRDAGGWVDSPFGARALARPGPSQRGALTGAAGACVLRMVSG